MRELTVLEVTGISQGLGALNMVRKIRHLNEMGIKRQMRVRRALEKSGKLPDSGAGSMPKKEWKSTMKDVTNKNGVMSRLSNRNPELHSNIKSQKLMSRGLIK